MASWILFHQQWNDTIIQLMKISNGGDHEHAQVWQAVMRKCCGVFILKWTQVWIDFQYCHWSADKYNDKISAFVTMGHIFLPFAIFCHLEQIHIFAINLNVIVLSYYYYFFVFKNSFAKEMSQVNNCLNFRNW